MNSKISRRHFIQKGSTAVMAATIIPHVFNANVKQAFAIAPGETMKLQDYYDHFQIDEKVIREVITEALARGGDYCDIYFEHTISNFIGLEDNAVNRAYSNIDFGVGIRVLKGDQTGYSFTEDITPRAMKLAAQTAANIANTNKKSGPVSLKLHDHPNYYPIKIPWETVSIEKKVPYLQQINEKVFAHDPRVIKCNVSMTNDTSYVLLATSDGRVVSDYRPMCQINSRVSAEQNGNREENYFSLGDRQGIEFFTPDNINRIADESVRRTLELFNAVKPEAGEMEVVLAAGSSGILLHEAIGHGMEADFNRKKISIFSDKINKPVAEKFVSIVDDGTNLNKRGALNVDDEGNATEKTYLVENGILKSYLHDKISAQFYQVQPTGSGRRQSFRDYPLPRMRCTYMLPGPHKKEEVIGSVNKGLYAESFTNGEVFIGAGDFTFYVKSGYLIENGKLTKPVKDINIIGNGPEVLRNVVMVADDLTMDEGGWTCGKDGQGVPVSMGLPTVKVAKITVGGVS